MNENERTIFEMDFNAVILFYVAMAVSAVSLMINVLFINKLVCVDIAIFVVEVVTFVIYSILTFKNDGVMIRLTVKH